MVAAGAVRSGREEPGIMPAHARRRSPRHEYLLGVCCGGRLFYLAPSTQETLREE